MINFPGRKLVSFYLTRRQKEFLFRSYNKLFTRESTQLKYPDNLSIALTTYCNLRCRFCDRADFKASHMSLENLYKLKLPISHAKVIDLTGWGEAILYKNYANAVDFILKNNDRKQIIAQTSNGTLCNRYSDILRGRINRFVISLNSASKRTYEKEMERGDFNKTLKSVESFMASISPSDRKNVKLHFVTYTENYKEMPAFVKLASDLGVPTVSFGQLLSNGTHEDEFVLMNIKDEYNELLNEVEENGKKHKVEVLYRRFGEDLGLNPAKCMVPFNDVYIRVDGEIAPCCYFGDKSFGNVFEDDFDKVWFSNSGPLADIRKSRSLPECGVCAPYHDFEDIKVHRTARYNQEIMFGSL